MRTPGREGRVELDRAGGSADKDAGARDPPPANLSRSIRPPGGKGFGGVGCMSKGPAWTVAEPPDVARAAFRPTRRDATRNDAGTAPSGPRRRYAVSRWNGKCGPPAALRNRQRLLSGLFDQSTDLIQVAASHLAIGNSRHRPHRLGPSSQPGHHSVPAPASGSRSRSRSSAAATAGRCGTPCTP